MNLKYYKFIWRHYEFQFRSITQSGPTLCGPMDCSTPGFPVHYQLPTPVHQVDDAILPSHPLSPSFPPALNLSQHQGFFPMSQLFVSGGQSIGASASGSVLPMNIQGWFPLGLADLISLLSRGLSGVFSSTCSSKASILRCSAFFMIQLLHPYLTTGKTIALTIWTFVSKGLLATDFSVF